MPKANGNLLSQLRAAQLPPPARRRRIRESAGASLRDLGDELGVAAITVWKWENGETTPRRDNAIAYRKLLEKLERAAS